MQCLLKSRVFSRGIYATNILREPRLPNISAISDTIIQYLTKFQAEVAPIQKLLQKANCMFMSERIHDSCSALLKIFELLENDYNKLENINNPVDSFKSTLMKKSKFFKT